MTLAELRLVIREEMSHLLEKGTLKRKYKGKTYRSSKGMARAETWDEKVRQASSWADDPEAAAAAATIVKTGKPPGAGE
jgi:predicted transcriptional regulator